MKAKEVKLIIGLVMGIFCSTTAQDIASQEITEETIIAGKMLFSGSSQFANGGASCIVCHNVTNNQLISGGLLAKDLTNVYSRMGEAGVSGILGSPPFPAMASSYKNNPLTEEEIFQLTAFFKHADEVSYDQQQKSGNEIFITYGPIGLMIWLILVYLIWFNRKKESVKKAVFDRQIKARN